MINIQLYPLSTRIIIVVLMVVLVIIILLLIEYYRKMKINVSNNNNINYHYEPGTMVSLYQSGKIDKKQLYVYLGKTKLYYSTPYGEDASGNGNLYALRSEKKDRNYLPAFTSEDNLRQFYTDNNRVNYLIINGSINSYVKTVRGINDDKRSVLKFGVIIDPGVRSLAIDIEDFDLILSLKTI